MQLLVTGGAGFIGSNFIRYMLNKYPSISIVNFDKLTYAGNLENLISVEHNPKYHFTKGDICDKSQVHAVIKKHNINIIVNFAAESHVDRSISEPDIFVQTNIMGTQTLLEAAKALQVTRYIQISTDEVYGSLGETGYFTEETPLAPNSPYSASKAGADLLVRAYHETYGLHTNITRCSNNYGPFHFPEKLIPLMITNALENKELPIYGNGLNIRDWLHVEDHAAAIDLVIQAGRPGEVYNIGGHNEWSNIDIVREILTLLGEPMDSIRYVEDRKGHDQRYAIDPSKIMEELQWKPHYTFGIGIQETIRWYLDNREWWQRIKTGEYKNYYKQQYEDRLLF
ncbi:dTDP-glucose 4,6-dehydratase [Paenibacillus sp. IHBB 10380]|uniref:dTDP-glucose 4,6-dehydratase n=1 Tax=Paenibacillus sp. IHBB 10380 TaxID=1566358 RepID=UPI0005CFAEE5|nr:dTDP-glucose 4,6-dehydratase [Paenibacillus sp. IHBB 10380]AJS60034.1 spore coat protein [Paenibacillus sp. IHBB 10380]